MKVFLGAATNHAIREAGPFLDSVAKNCSHAEVWLLIYPKDQRRPELADLLGRFKNLRVRTVFRLGRRIRPWILRVDRVTEGTLRRAGGWRRLLRGCLHITQERFLAARDFLLEKERRNCPLAICDIRDVLVQADPWKEPLQKVVTGEEGERMGRCPTNRGWYQELYGPAALEEIANQPILCSGVTLGKSAPMREYLEAMSAEIWNRLLPIGERGYFDQAIHNHILRGGTLPFELSPIAGGRISTVGYPKSCRVSWAPDQKTVLVDGAAPTIVHQYDRVLPR